MFNFFNLFLSLADEIKLLINRQPVSAVNFLIRFTGLLKVFLLVFHSISYTPVHHLHITVLIIHHSFAFSYSSVLQSVLTRDRLPTHPIDITDFR